MKDFLVGLAALIFILSRCSDPRTIVVANGKVLACQYFDGFPGLISAHIECSDVNGRHD